MSVLEGVSSMLVVGAHAFDAEVIAGPLAATAAHRGIPVTLLHLSLGEQGHRTLPPAEYAAQKREESVAAAESLGVRAISLELPDAFVPNDDEMALAVCDVIRETRADLVITHWRGSWHKDHRAAHQATVDGLLFAGLPTLQRASPAQGVSDLLFGENWEDHDGFEAEILVDVTEGVRRWEEAIRQYELGRDLAAFPYYDHYSELYRKRGAQLGTSHAQAFMRPPKGAIAGITQFIDPAEKG